MDPLLSKAATVGSLSLIEEAIENGADINARSAGGRTVLTMMLEPNIGSEEALRRVRFLLRLGAKVHLEEPGMPLGGSVHQCARYGYVAALRELLAADGKAVLNSFDDMGRTPLIMAIWGNSIPAAELLLEAGSDVNIRDAEHMDDGALGVAVRDRKPEMVRLLLRYGADPDLAGWMQMTPVDYAEQWVEEEPSQDALNILQLVRAALRRP